MNIKMPDVYGQYYNVTQTVIDYNINTVCTLACPLLGGVWESVVRL